MVSVITQVCTEAKLGIHPNLRQSNIKFTYSLKVRLHLHLHCRYMDFNSVMTGAPIIYKPILLIFRANPWTGFSTLPIAIVHVAIN